MASIVSDRTDAQLDSLPFVVGAHFCNGDIELMFHLIHYTPDDFPLPFQRTVVVHMKDYFHHSDDHELKLCGDLFNQIDLEYVPRFDILEIL